MTASASRSAVAASSSLPATVYASTLGLFSDEQVDGLRLILNHISEAILLLDGQGCIQMINPAGERLLGISRQESAGQCWTRFLCQPFVADYHALLQQWRCRNQPNHLMSHGPSEALITRADGSDVEVDISIANLPSERRLYLVVIHSLTVHKREHHELRRLARTDHLTQLANRRAFDEVLARCWQEGAQQQTSLALILIDIDHFKSFNDRYGHLQGDSCLRQIAIAIEQSLPTPRLVGARYGGEEFAVILPSTEAYAALRIANEIRLRVAAIDWSELDGETPLTVTVSQGLACVVPDDRVTPFTLVASADQALYCAKRSGRNRVVISQREEAVQAQDKAELAKLDTALGKP